MNASCHTHKWVKSHIWMSHVTHTSESCHKYEWAMTTFHFLTDTTSVIFGKIIAYVVTFHILRDNHICDRIYGPWLTFWEILSYNHSSLKSDVKSEYVIIFCEKWLCDGCNAATHCNTLQHTATHFSTLQHTATQYHTHFNTLQHTATHCNTLQHSDYAMWILWRVVRDYLSKREWLRDGLCRILCVVVWWILLHVGCDYVMDFVACCAWLSLQEVVNMWKILLRGAWFVWLCDEFRNMLCVIRLKR